MIPARVSCAGAREQTGTDKHDFANAKLHCGFPF
jgi:hypothetical protein